MNKMINPGELNYKMQIQKWQKSVDDDGLGEQGKYTDYKSVYCKMLKQRITPVSVNGDSQSIVVTQGFITRPVDVCKGDKVIVKNREYDVIDIDESDKTQITITTKVINL